MPSSEPRAQDRPRLTGAGASRLRLCVVDMNDGRQNQAIRCFHGILERFLARVRASNPAIRIDIERVQPRNLGEAPPAGCDLYLSSGGPGSPFDGYDEPWCTAYRRFLDTMLDHHATLGDEAPAAFLVCHSFELSVLHFAVGRMVTLEHNKFGIQPVYPTAAGQRSELLGPFGDRLFAWENRGWQAVGLDEGRLRALGAELWARESRPGRKDKGEALLAFRYAPNLVAVQFHPEADRRGAAAWLYRPEQALLTIQAFGEQTYRRMLRTLDTADRLPRTYTLMVPGWLTRHFNRLAPHRGWQPVALPVWDPEAALAQFGVPQNLPPARRRSTPPPPAIEPAPPAGGARRRSLPPAASAPEAVPVAGAGTTPAVSEAQPTAGSATTSTDPRSCL